MENSIKYHFADFTRDEYRKLIKLAKNSYEFINYQSIDLSKRFILWRHDVDFSVHSAHKLAKIENEENVTATYFLHPHSEFYNLFEKEIVELVKSIINLGHQIGLHFDTHFYGIQKEEELEKYILFEKEQLEFVFNHPIKVFSFHNTNPFVLSCKNKKYGGLLNTYADVFQNQIAYCSDSYGIWRFKRLKDVLSKGDSFNLQVLTHPEYWIDEVMSPKGRVMRCIDGRSENLKKNYHQFLVRNGRDFIDW